MNTEPIRITIEQHGMKYTAEMSCEANIEDVVTAIRGLLVAASWNIEMVNEYIPMPE